MEVVDAIDAPTLPEGSPPLSKRAQKKLEKKMARKAAKAGAKQAQKAANESKLAEKRAAFEALSEDEKNRIREVQARRNKDIVAKKEELKQKMEEAVSQGQKIVIDLEFDDKMTDNEIVSLTQQLAYCQAKNAKADVPVCLVMSSMKGRIAESLDLRMKAYTKWLGVSMGPENYLETFAHRRDDLIYLTADAREPLETLDPQKIYIVGGIVDRNRHKNICFKKAKTQGIAIARLPIDEHVKMNALKVLTVDQVVELLLRYKSTGDWKSAITQSIPVRKLGVQEGTDATPTADDPNLEKPCSNGSNGQTERSKKQSEPTVVEQESDNDDDTLSGGVGRKQAIENKEEDVSENAEEEGGLEPPVQKRKLTD